MVTSLQAQPCLCFRVGSDLFFSFFFNLSGLCGIPVRGTLNWAWGHLCRTCGLQVAWDTILEHTGRWSDCFFQLTPAIDPTVTYSWASELLSQQSWTLLTVSLQQNCTPCVPTVARRREANLLRMALTVRFSIFRYVQHSSELTVQQGQNFQDKELKTKSLWRAAIVTCTHT